MARQIAKPNLDPNCMTLMVFLKDFFHLKNLISEKSADNIKTNIFTQQAVLIK